MMKKRDFIIAVGFLAFVLAVGVVVMLLWNWLLPPLIGIADITFWQALGMFALCRILLGGSGLRRHFGHHRDHFIHEKWRNMSPEEREQFIKRRGFGHDWFAGYERHEKD
ncbi:MAG: hypothetical protein LBP56_11085 [Odoribacteraceae bacterium]|jgi:hypothetical protein|nr:hypothetical protein [Odoribacteraceae bacterium]